MEPEVDAEESFVLGQSSDVMKISAVDQGLYVHVYMLQVICTYIRSQYV